MDISKDKKIYFASDNHLGAPSNKESRWIPVAIHLRSRLLLEFACNLRAKQVVKIRNKGKE